MSQMRLFCFHIIIIIKVGFIFTFYLRLIDFNSPSILGFIDTHWVFMFHILPNGNAHPPATSLETVSMIRIPLVSATSK